MRARGAILVVIIVCFVVAATLFVLLARSAVAERRAAETRYWSLQAQWLGEAALERAAARLATDPKYDGETWTVPAEEFAGNQGGVVKIGVEEATPTIPAGDWSGSRPIIPTIRCIAAGGRNRLSWSVRNSLNVGGTLSQQQCLSSVCRIRTHSDATD